MVSQKHRISQMLAYLAQINSRTWNDVILDLYIRELNKFPENLAIEALEKAVCSGKFPSVDELRESVGLPARSQSKEDRRAIQEGQISKWIAEIRSSAFNNSSDRWSQEAAQIANIAGISPREVYDNWNSETERNFHFRIRAAAKSFLANKSADKKQIGSASEAEYKRLNDPLMR